MDAIICSRNSKHKNNTLLSKSQWSGAKRYLLVFGILMIIHEVIDGATSTDTMLFFCIFKPVLMALFFFCFFIIRNFTLQKEDVDLTSRKKIALIIVNDIYHVVGLCTIMIIDGIQVLKNGEAVSTYFSATKFWLLIVFSLNAFFLLSSKICFYGCILCFQAVELIYYTQTEDEWRIGVQAFISLAALVVIVCLLDKEKNDLTSSYLDAKNQEKAWRHVLEFLREGVIIIDKNGEYVYGNRCVNRILGFEPRLSELNYNIDLSKIKNMKFHTEFKMPSSKAKSTTPRNMSNEGHLYEDRLLNINLERTSNLKEILDFLRSKWINTVDLLRKLSTENGGCLHLEGETDELGTRVFIEARITILSYEDKNNLLVALYSATPKPYNAVANAVAAAVSAPTKESEKSRDKLISTAFHQLLHPLHGSMNYLKASIENNLTPPSIRDLFLSPGLTGLSCLSNTIYDLVDLFSLNSSSLRMRFNGHSLLDTIKETIALVAAQAEKKGLAIIKTFKISPKLICYTDHRRLQQILLNILSTAIKYTFKGTISVSIVKVSYKDFMIKIEDTGIGLSEDDVKKLVDDRGKIKLYPLSSAEIFGENEAGIMISNELAKRLGPIAIPDSCGIFIESEEEKGSTFQFLIEDKSYSQKSDSGDHYKINIIEDYKLRSYDFESDDSTDAIPTTDYCITAKFLPDEAYSRPRHLKSAKAGSSRKSVSVTRKTNSARRLGQCSCAEVLIIDDDIYSVTSLEQIMSICRFSSSSCFNGLEGIREIMRRKDKKCGKKCTFLKLIFVEMSMPMMGGEEFIATVKDLIDKNEIPFVHIIGCSKTYEESELKKARGAGAADCIVKPVSKEKILELLQKIDLK